MLFTFTLTSAHGKSKVCLSPGDKHRRHARFAAVVPSQTEGGKTDRRVLCPVLPTAAAAPSAGWNYKRLGRLVSADWGLDLLDTRESVLSFPCTLSSRLRDPAA
ncbi:unnamed protein product [Lota lota]